MTTRDGRQIYNIRKAELADGYFIDVHKQYVLGRALFVGKDGKHYADGRESPNDVDQAYLEGR